METQNLLHSRSNEIPEGLYIELMNKLKIDFENRPKQIIILDEDIEIFKKYVSFFNNNEKNIKLYFLLSINSFCFLFLFLFLINR